MAFINTGRHVGRTSFGLQLMLAFNIKTQGNIPDPTATPPLLQFPYSGTPGSSQEIERTLTDLPDFQIGETITGSANSFTATVSALAESGTTEFATSVGGGVGGPGEEHGYGGGSGGGGASNNWGATGGGLSVAGQGNNGGGGGDRNSGSGASGGGGGAGAAGNSGGGSTGGAGGNGANNAFRTGSNIIYAGGGGGAGGGTTPNSAAGGTGGGGTGASGGVNLGGGGGTAAAASHGGSGIVVIRYDTSQSGFSLAGGTSNTYSSGGVNYQSNTFLSTGNLTVTGTGNVDAMVLSGGGSSGGTGGSAEGGFYQGGGGGGGMLVSTGTQVVAGTYAVEVGAGGTGGSTVSAGTGHLSWITPRRVLTVTGQTGDFVAGETITGGTTDATGDIISV